MHSAAIGFRPLHRSIASASSAAQRRAAAARRLVTALLVSAVLLFAAVAKLAGVVSAVGAANRNAQTLGVAAQSVASGVAMDVFIAAAEVVVVALLLLFRKRWWMWAFTAAMFSAYAAYAGSELARGAESCGCFGPINVPPVITFSLDTVTLVVSLALALGGTFGNRRFAGWMVSAMGIAAISGLAYAHATAPPSSALTDNPELQATFDAVFALPELESVASASASSPLWLLFVYDVYCEHCAEFLPFMRAREQEWASDARFRVRTFSMQDAQEKAGVPLYKWPSTPTIAIVKQGVVVELLPSDRVFDPVEARTRILSQ